MSDPVATLQQTLHGMGDPAIAEHAQRFFKTGPGQYGEGDVFRGIRVPVLRKLVRAQDMLSLGDVARLLRSRYHEDRLLALLLLVRRYKRGDAAMSEAVYQCYLDNTAYINNWDLVDTSAAQIVGAHVQERSRGVLYQLAASRSFWERRIAIIATFAFIRQNDFEDTLKLAALLLKDQEDLIHKAIGWMLREVGKRHLEAEEMFLRAHYQEMPRTMLRYAIEKFPEAKRQAYLKGTI